MAPGQVADVHDLPPDFKVQAQRASSLISAQTDAMFTAPLANRFSHAPTEVPAATTEIYRPNDLKTWGSAPLPRAIDRLAASSGSELNFKAGPDYLTETRQINGDHSIETPTSLSQRSATWKGPLEQLAKAMLSAQPRDIQQVGESDLMDQLAKQFEASLITVALQHTKGRRIEAAVRLGIGRNTITRKIQELKLDE